MRTGLLLDNLSQPAADSYLKLQAMSAGSVGILWTAGTQHKRPVYERCEDILDKPTYLVRIGGHKQTAQGWVDDAKASFMEMPEHIPLESRAVWVVGNEPNIEFGTAEDYGQFYQQVVSLLGGVPLLFACPSMGIEDWWTYLETALAQGPKPQGICLNAYDHLIGEVSKVIATCGDVPCYIGEVNTLQPNRVPWLLGAFNALESAGVIAATIFIAGGEAGIGPDGKPNWDERYIVSLDECQQLQWTGGPMPTTQEQINQLLAQNALIAKGFVQIREDRWTGADGLDGTIVALNGGKVPDGFKPVFPKA